jgi:acyl-CoA dehydrogenase
MEYHSSEKAKQVEARVKSFIEEEVLPREREALETGDFVSQDEIEEFWEIAKEANVFAPQMPEKYGGQGLSFRDMLPAFEQVGRSLIGARALRADGPDEGTMHLFEQVGTEEQKETWLRPLVQGAITSGFSMTEPVHGAGSDPKMMKTTARKDGDEWVINGHKWWTTNGNRADFFLVMARTDLDAHPYEGSSLLIVPADTDGVEVVRNIPHLGEAGITEDQRGHAEIKYKNVRVPVENTLGDEGGGFRAAQLRLGGGRLTNCMRFSGMADRALEVSKAYLQERQAFGEELSDKQSLRHRIAEAETELHAVRTMVRHASRELDRSEARVETAMAKMYAARVTNDILDLAVQCCGANGIGRDLPIAYFYEEVRPFRLGDGGDEVHLRTIAQHAFEDIDSTDLQTMRRFDESLDKT